MAASVLRNALAEELLANEGRHGLGVVLETGGRAVRGASAFPLEIVLDEVLASFKLTRK